MITKIEKFKPGILPTAEQLSSDHLKFSSLLDRKKVELLKVTLNLRKLTESQII